MATNYVVSTEKLSHLLKIFKLFWEYNTFSSFEQIDLEMINQIETGLLGGLVTCVFDNTHIRKICFFPRIMSLLVYTNEGLNLQLTQQLRYLIAVANCGISKAEYLQLVTLEDDLLYYWRQAYILPLPWHNRPSFRLVMPKMAYLGKEMDSFVPEEYIMPDNLKLQLKLAVYTSGQGMEYQLIFSDSIIHVKRIVLNTQSGIFYLMLIDNCVNFFLTPDYFDMVAEYWASLEENL